MNHKFLGLAVGVLSAVVTIGVSFDRGPVAQVVGPRYADIKEPEQVCLAQWEDNWSGGWYQGAPCMRKSLNTLHPWCWHEPETNCLGLTFATLWYEDAKCPPGEACKFRITMWVDTEDPCVGRVGVGCDQPPCCTTGYDSPNGVLAMGTSTFVEQVFLVNCGTSDATISIVFACTVNPHNYVWTPGRKVSCGECM